MWVFLRGRTYFVEAVRQVRSHVGESSLAGDGTIVSPMPGKIFKLLVAEGDAVKAGQDIVILEAMKMEHALRAPRDGKIAGLKIVPGELVEAGQTLAVVVA
jgi:3-methylcrotonyl-CoA carboxylase alpha subunit